MTATTDQWVEMTGEGRLSGVEEKIHRREEQLNRLKALYAAATTPSRTKEAIERAVCNLTGQPFDESAFKPKVPRARAKAARIRA